MLPQPAVPAGPPRELTPEEFQAHVERREVRVRRARGGGTAPDGPPRRQAWLRAKIHPVTGFLDPLAFMPHFPIKTFRQPAVNFTETLPFKCATAFVFGAGCRRAPRTMGAAALHPGQRAHARALVTAGGLFGGFMGVAFTSLDAPQLPEYQNATFWQQMKSVSRSSPGRRPGLAIAQSRAAAQTERKRDEGQGQIVGAQLRGGGCAVHRQRLRHRQGAARSLREAALTDPLPRPRQVRAKHDAYNAVVAGFGSGAMLACRGACSRAARWRSRDARAAGPKAALAGGAAFATFSGIIEYVSDGLAHGVLALTALRFRSCISCDGGELSQVRAPAQPLRVQDTQLLPAAHHRSHLQDRAKPSDNQCSNMLQFLAQRAHAGIECGRGYRASLVVEGVQHRLYDRRGTVSQPAGESE
jgi:hypothetical protein